MTEVLRSPSHFPTSSSSSPSPSVSSPSSSNSLSCVPPSSSSRANREDSQNECNREADSVKETHRDQQLSLLALLVTLFRKSWVTCKTADRRELCAMEIGWPSNVRHVAHVTFDRFNGFLGLPVEFEPEVPRRAPSASATVFGVSTESMQLSYDSRGNCVPMILLLMQSCLYDQGGLQAEGIFRLTAGNSQEEFVRHQLNHGVVPEGTDVHCLAGLIKAWFRELPAGILDSLTPEEVMRCESEEECAALVRLLPSTEAALLDWAINLMADVVQQEHVNKMNARNIAMVFAPNMTQMADPLTALMYAVQVMNFLKTLILRTLREREDSVLEQTPSSRIEPFDENGHQSLTQSFTEDGEDEFEKIEQQFIVEAPAVKGSCNSSPDQVITDGEGCGSKTLVGKVDSGDELCEAATQVDSVTNEQESGRVAGPKATVQGSPGKSRAGQSNNSNLKRGPTTKVDKHLLAEKTLGISKLSCIDSRTERIEAWR